MELCLNATYLTYRGEHHRQTFSAAMGSPMSVTVANLVMEDVEQQALATFPNSLRFWKRHVGDTLTALQSSQVESFHHHLHSLELSIKFTLEMEEGGCLPFLDTELTHHQNGSISISVYKKDMHTKKYLDFRSHHPLVHKLSVIKTLLSRAGPPLLVGRGAEQRGEACF